MSEFGPTYPKINTCFKRESNGVIIPWDWAQDEFAYLADNRWEWTEKIDGTNIRLFWDGSTVTVGGRTDRANLPAKLIANLEALGVLNTDLWATVFPDGSPVTVFGEGYGAGIQRGGSYGDDQKFIVFDVLAGRWWLKRESVLEVAHNLGLQCVPLVGVLSLRDMIQIVSEGQLTSQWPNVWIEGVVGRTRPLLCNRRGTPLLAKVKVRDFEDLRTRGGAA